jgi:hypothetical protein
LLAFLYLINAGSTDDDNIVSYHWEMVSGKLGSQTNIAASDLDKELRTGRAARGPGRAGPDNSNFADGPGRAGPSSRNLGPARFVSSRSCCVSRSMPRVAFSLCLVMKISGKFPET